MYSNYISVSDKLPFEQGDTNPKLYSGYENFKASHLSTFTNKVSEVIASKHSSDKKHEFHVAFVPHKTEGYYSDQFASNMSNSFSTLVVVIFMIPFMNFFQKALEEKVNKNKEYMRMMGMKDSAYNISWIIYYTIQIIIICTEMATITWIWLAPHSSLILIFMYYFLYAASLFGWVISFVAVFNNIKTGSAAGVIIHFATYYAIYAVPKNASYMRRALVSVFPNLALAQGTEILWKLEEQNIGLNFSTMSMTFKNYNIFTYFIMLIIDIGLSTLIGLYLTYTLPTDFGLRKHP